MPKFAVRWMALGWVLASAAPAWTEVDFAELAHTTPVERVQQTMDTFAGLGSRVAGYRGADQAAQIVQERFRAIGLDDIAVHEYDVSIPVDKGGFLQVVGSDEQVPIHGLWPNLVKTSTLPEGGVTQRLIDAGAGEYADMDGQQVEGAVALMDFNSDDAWLNAAYLGAQAILFIEPDSTVYLEGEKKFLSMPLDLPRFWVNRQAGQRLRRQLATEGEQSLHLEYRMDWERRPAWNILGSIPGYDPLMKEDVIVLEAYYDAMSVVPALAPGAEQASSITALLELARYFRANPPARTIVFLATSAHHLGLRGVDDFIQRYLRKEDPFIEHMLVRRVVDAALARDLIAQDGIHYAIGEDTFTGKEALVRGVAEGRTDLAVRVADAALAEGLLAQAEATASSSSWWKKTIAWLRGLLRREEGVLHLADKQFKDRSELVAQLDADDDLRLALYKRWADPKIDSLAGQALYQPRPFVPDRRARGVEQQYQLLLQALLRPLRQELYGICAHDQPRDGLPAARRAGQRHQPRRRHELADLCTRRNIGQQRVGVGHRHAGVGLCHGQRRPLPRRYALRPRRARQPRQSRQTDPGPRRHV